MDRKDLDVTLYLVTDSTYHTEESLLHTVEEACKGGVTLVQLREKNKGGREYLDKAFKVKDIGPSFLQSAQVHAVVIQRDMSYLAAHSLIDARQAQIARILNGIHLVRAKQLNQHGIEQLGARTDNNVVGVDIHTPRPAQMMSNCAS